MKTVLRFVVKKVFRVRTWEDFKLMCSLIFMFIVITQVAYTPASGWANPSILTDVIDWIAQHNIRGLMKGGE